MVIVPSLKVSPDLAGTKLIGTVGVSMTQKIVQRGIEYGGEGSKGTNVLTIYNVNEC